MRVVSQFSVCKSGGVLPTQERFAIRVFKAVLSWTVQGSSRQCGMFFAQGRFLSLCVRFFLNHGRHLRDAEVAFAAVGQVDARQSTNETK